MRRRKQLGMTMRLPMELGESIRYDRRNDDNHFHRLRAQRIIWRILEIEYYLKSKVDRDWQTDHLATEFRSLMKEWWNLPSGPAMQALYDTKEGRKLAKRPMTRVSNQEGKKLHFATKDCKEHMQVGMFTYYLTGFPASGVWLRGKQMREVLEKYPTKKKRDWYVCRCRIPNSLTPHCSRRSEHVGPHIGREDSSILVWEDKP